MAHTVYSLQTSYHNGNRKNDMKEVLTKSFWEGVKRTFQEALEGPPPADTALQTPAERDLKPPSTSETSSPPSVSSEQH
jgi:hypothetical protein